MNAASGQVAIYRFSVSGYATNRDLAWGFGGVQLSAAAQFCGDRLTNYPRFWCCDNFSFTPQRWLMSLARLSSPSECMGLPCRYVSNRTDIGLDVFHDPSRGESDRTSWRLEWSGQILWQKIRLRKLARRFSESLPQHRRWARL